MGRANDIGSGYQFNSTTPDFLKALKGIKKEATIGDKIPHLISEIDNGERELDGPQVVIGKGVSEAEAAFHINGQEVKVVEPTAKVQIKSQFGSRKVGKKRIGATATKPKNVSLSFKDDES